MDVNEVEKNDSVRRLKENWDIREIDGKTLKDTLFMGAPNLIRQWNRLTI